ncbi:MAG TPA: hypothetical protein VGF69_09810 [Thermoanaerobaculia bacterium]|jgi:hypothetical protein
MRIALSIVAIVGTVVALLLLVGFVVTRPQSADFNDPTQWTLVKIGKVHSTPAEVRVYIYNREPSIWDSHNILQNKVVVADGRREYVYMWPSNDDYAAGWCELFAPDGGGVAIALFERGVIARVVHYSNGEFKFRRNNDEVVATREFKYADLNKDGRPEFSDDGTGRTWQWTVAEGFRPLKPFPP